VVVVGLVIVIRVLETLKPKQLGSNLTALIPLLVARVLVNIFSLIPCLLFLCNDVLSHLVILRFQSLDAMVHNIVEAIFAVEFNTTLFEAPLETFPQILKVRQLLTHYSQFLELLDFNHARKGLSKSIHVRHCTFWYLFN
jgi:hypothetical protein